MKTAQTPIIPGRQAMVRIAGYEVLSICTVEGNTAAGVRRICDLLGVDRSGQMRKLQADLAFRDCLILAQVEVTGKQRVVHFIIAELIPLWLKGIHPSKVAPEARETLIEFQRVAVQTLRAFFSPETREQPHAAPPKEEPTDAAPDAALPEPLAFPPLGDEARYAYWTHMYRAYDSLERHLRTIDARLMSLSEQMDEVRQVLNQHTTALNQHLEALVQHKELLEQHHKQLHALNRRVDGYGDQVNALTEQVKRLDERVSVLEVRLTSLGGPSPLTAGQQGELRGRMQALSHQTGQPASALERELLAAFGVETVSQLSEATWGEVVAWLRQRLGW